MAQEFKLIQFPGVRLEFSIYFNTKEPNTVVLYRGNDSIAKASNYPVEYLDDEITEYEFSENGYLDLGKNMTVATEYLIVCETEVGLSDYEQQINDTKNGFLKIGFDDNRGQVVDYDDATVEITFSE